MLGGFPCPPVQGQPTVTMLTSILGQDALVTVSSGESGVQSPGTAGCGWTWDGSQDGKEAGCVFAYKKQQRRSCVAGTWSSGASTPRSPCPQGRLPCSAAWASGSSLGSMKPHCALSKAGSQSNGVLPLDLPKPPEVSQLRPEGRTGAGWAGGAVGRARRGRGLCGEVRGAPQAWPPEGSCLGGSRDCIPWRCF